jgi:hypothetical protein
LSDLDKSINLIDKDIKEKYYELNFDESAVKLIHNEQELLAFLDDMDRLTKSCNDLVYVGMDTEWKPTCATAMMTEEQNKVAVIQVATLDSIYLIDMIYLAGEGGSSSVNASVSKMFAERFLYNKRIVKLGYGFTHDIKMVIKSFVDVNDADSFRQTVLDLAYFVQQVSYLI